MRFGPLFTILLSTIAYSQKPPACGPAHPSFHIATVHQTAPAIPEGKAALYVLQQVRGPYSYLFGIDGQWVGADRGRSWFTVAVGPGEHHACVLIATHPGHTSALHSLSLEAGKSYYLDIQADPSSLLLARFLIRELDPDEARARMKKSRQVRATFAAH